MRRVQADYAARPKGQVLWVVAEGQGKRLRLAAFLSRLRGQYPDLTVVVTSDDLQLEADSRTFSYPSLGDGIASITNFLDHFAPDLCLWIGGALLPNVISKVAEANIPMILIEAEPDDFDIAHPGWLPDLRKVLLGYFTAIYPASNLSREKIAKIASDLPTRHPCGLLEIAQATADCDLELHETVANQLSGRPVWFAVCPTEHDLVRIVDMQSMLTRRSHRTMLVIDQSNQLSTDNARALSDEKGLRLATWTTDASPSDATQILISLDPEARALWYRIAAFTYLGGSFDSDGLCVDPRDSVALGAPVVFGPNTGRYADVCQILTSRGAAVQVSDDTVLSKAAIQFNTPDTLAQMSLAGWQCISDGAELTDTLVEHCLDILDGRV